MSRWHASLLLVLFAAVLTEAPAAAQSSSAGARGAPAQPGVSTGGTQRLQTPQSLEGRNYWGTDWCHYYYRQGAWYGDVCVRPAADSTGQAIPNLYNEYAYPGPGRSLGNAFEQYDTSATGYTTIRDLRNQLFNTVQWVRWPSGTTATVSNTQFLVNDSSSGGAIWFTGADLINIVRSGQGAQYGFPATTTAASSGTWVSPNTSQWLDGMDTRSSSTWINPGTASGHKRRRSPTG